MAKIIAIGHCLLGHFEERTPKWRKVAKLLGALVIAVLISANWGRAWFFAVFALGTLIVLYIHLWWLPSHGINGWTGEPKEEYYRLRGWNTPDVNSDGADHDLAHGRI
jgi:hypothetical protein